MSAQRISGWIAAVSGVTLLILATFSSVAGSSWPRGSTGATMMGGPGMMGGLGMMGSGMMGGPGMMGSGNMWSPGDVTRRGDTDAIRGAPTVTVTASEFRFSPSKVTLPSREANLTLANQGAVLHDVVITDLGVRVVANAGQTTTVGLRDLPAGRYAGFCSVPGHAEAGMRMTVVVQ